MKALAFPGFVLKVLPLFTCGKLKVVEAEKPNRANGLKNLHMPSCFTKPLSFTLLKINEISAVG